jgi:hypothetical protein
MDIALAFMARHWLWFVTAALVAAFGIQSARLEHAKADLRNPATGKTWQSEAKRDGPLLKRAVADLGQCRDNEGRLQGSLEVQNAAVERLGADGQARSAAAASAAADARQARALADRTAAQLAAFKSADSCSGREAAIQTLVEGLTR